MGDNFSYLETEEQNFMRAFHLSEEEVLAAYGGLKGYTAHRLDRHTARQANVGNNYPGVPQLPQSPEEALEHYHIEDKKLTDAGLAREIIREQVEKVKGINQAVQANVALKEATTKSKQDDTLRVRAEAMYLAKSYPDWPGDSGQRCLGMSDEAAELHKQDIEGQKELCIVRAVREIRSRRQAV